MRTKNREIKFSVATITREDMTRKKGCKATEQTAALIASFGPMKPEEVREVKCSNPKDSALLFYRLGSYIEAFKVPYGVSRSGNLVFVYKEIEGEKK